MARDRFGPFFVLRPGGQPLELTPGVSFVARGSPGLPALSAYTLTCDVSSALALVATKST